MITRRRLAIFSFSALLAGSAVYSASPAFAETLPCPPPGALQPELAPPETKCHYELTITDIGKGGLIKGKVAQRVLKKNKEENPEFPIDKYQHRQYDFHVKDSPKLTKDKDYAFEGVPGSSDLSCRTPCEPVK